MSDCTKCADYEWCAKNEECGMFNPKTMTNADKIRGMTDEELAKWIRDQIIDRNIGIPSETWLDWLREECDK